MEKTEKINNWVKKYGSEHLELAYKYSQSWEPLYVKETFHKKYGNKGKINTPRVITLHNIPTERCFSRTPSLSCLQIYDIFVNKRECSEVYMVETSLFFEEDSVVIVILGYIIEIYGYKGDLEQI